MKKETDMRIEQQIAGISHSVDKEMAGFSHTLTCCLSKLRSSLEAGKRQLRVWLQYACSLAEEFLCLSFSGSLVLLWSLYGNIANETDFGGSWTYKLSLVQVLKP